MKMYVFRVNPAMPHAEMFYQTIAVIAESEQQARELANAKCGAIASHLTQDTQLVGVHVETKVTYDQPYLHRHITSCECVDITPQVIGEYMPYADDDD